MAARAVQCSGCGERIFFALTDAGKSMPVEYLPTADGTVLVTEAKPVPKCSVVSRGQAAGMRAAGHELHRAHWATCPRADLYRENDTKGRKR